MYLCLDTAWSSKNFEGEEYLCCAIKAEHVTDIPVRYGKTDIPVPFAEGHYAPSIFYISPICFQTRLFGYTILKFNFSTSYDFSFRDWSKTVADTLEFLRMKNDIHYLTQCRSETSLYDSLTGFYNLREFRQIAEESENCSMYAVKLNFAVDGEFMYGENYRSDIISAAARAIKQACISHEICCRAYEVIFLMLCKGERRFAERMRVMLHEAMSCYDERQVLISYVETVECTVDKLCAAVAEKSEQDMAELAERQTLQHYSALSDIRNSVMSVPNKALTLARASKRLCVSEGYFRTVWRQCFDVSYNQDCINARVLKACYLLLTTAMSVYAVAVSCGYADEKYFARQFRQNVGCSPVQYRGKIS